MDQKLNGGDAPKPTNATSGDEEDPCIQETNQKSHGKNFRQRTEQKLRDKSGLSEMGLRIAAAVVIVLILLLITVIALGAAWPRTPHHLQYPVCQEAACLEAAAQVRILFTDIIFLK